MNGTTITRSRAFRLAVLVTLFAVTGLLVNRALAQEDAPPPPPAVGTMQHPVFPLLDADGVHVLDSAGPVSTMQTCGQCHDTDFIATHSFHTDVGLSAFGAPGSVADGAAWDTSPGPFGRWNPLVYRYLSPQGDAVVDLTTPEWVQLFGARHVGGGPATTARDGAPLVTLPPDAAAVESSIRAADGTLVGWDWQQSGVVEMNCFLCHTPEPDNDARLAALAAGEFGWANSATLAASGLISAASDGWAWNRAAFDADGNLKPAYVALQEPTNAACGQCHGVVHSDADAPLVLSGYAAGDYSSMTTGQIMSADKIAQSGLNLSGKAELTRSWDVHTERVVSCTNCHYALNNPVYFQESAEKQLDYLLFDPRRIDLSDYLYRPLHQFAKGQSAQSGLAPELDNTLRRCESCHSIDATHNWLPYKERHVSAVACESCHIPQLYAPALQYVDWTVLNADGTPATAYRGLDAATLDAATLDAATLDAATLVTGYTPVLLPRAEAGGARLAPFNLIATWYWVYGEPARPVPLAELQAALLDGDGWQAEVAAALDVDGDGGVDSAELRLDTPEQQAVIAARLSARGLDNPRIAGDVLPFSINHNVAHDEWVTKECRACHGAESRLAQPLDLADRTPGGVMPALGGSGVVWSGSLTHDADGALRFTPQPSAAGLYILGHDAVDLIDWLGVALFLGVIAGAAAHGGLRVLAARRHAAAPRHAPALREIYMYDVYERLWHWLQTVAILLLIFTGLVIHKPDKFGIFSFSYVVQVHNILAAILVINAALSLFYHLVSGEIRQYLPRPRGFFDQAIVQARYYLGGIFRGEPHPVEKTRARKLNPLQQITYFGILNVLLPLQIITGALMWGVQRWPTLAGRLGGLPFLAPFHTLIAWLFASFVVMHVYLTTTGHTPLAGIKAMMLGWDEVEAPTTQTPAEAGD